MKRKTRVYLEAARRIAEGAPVTRFACVMIHAVANGAPFDARHYAGWLRGMPDERRDFDWTFNPLHDPAGDEFSFPGWLEISGEPREESQHRRVMALCFAAAMAETGDL